MLPRMMPEMALVTLIRRRMEAGVTFTPPATR